MAVDVGTVLLTAGLLAMAGLGVGGPIRAVLAVAFVTFVPGWALLDHVRLAEGISRVALAVALSLTICAAATLVPLWLGFWHPIVLLDVLGLLSLTAVTWHLALHRDPFRAGRLRVSLRSLRPADALLPAALALWVLAVPRVDQAAMDDWGLLVALPVVFFLAVGLLVTSVGFVLLRPQLSPVRLGAHLVALVLVLHGTGPLLFAEPAYSWTYKHVGVVNYINLHGSLDPRIDIYQNWPAFFAPAAWLTRIAGSGSPLDYAVWTPVYFNLLVCLELAFLTRSLPVGSRVRWLGMFVLVAGNWVGQDYFAPQSMAFVLSLAVFGMVLAWLRVDRLSAPMRALRRLGRRTRLLAGLPRGARPNPEPPLTGWLRGAAFAATLAVFAVVVVAHQLSPYMIVLGVGLLTVAGYVRPRWFVVALVGVAIGYLLPHLSFLERSHSLFSPVGPQALVDFLRDPFHYLEGRADESVGLPGRRITSLAAPALVLGLWGAGMLGAARRLRIGRPAGLLCLLAVSPVLIFIGSGYGGEAILRIHLFSLPWTAIMAASVLEPRVGRWGVRAAAGAALGLAVVVVLFMSAVFGSAELHRIRPGSIEASRHFYDHAEAGSVLVVAGPNFPSAVGARYDKFDGPVVLTADERFRHRVLGSADIDAISALAGDSGRPLYLALSADVETWTEVFGLLPRGSLQSLDAALAASADWLPVYRNEDAVIYRLGTTATDPGRVAASPTVLHRPWEAWAGAGIASLALTMLGLAWARRRRILERIHPVLGRETRGKLASAGSSDSNRGAPSDAQGAATGTYVFDLGVTLLLLVLHLVRARRQDRAARARHAAILAGIAVGTASVVRALVRGRRQRQKNWSGLGAPRPGGRSSGRVPSSGRYPPVRR